MDDGSKFPYVLLGVKTNKKILLCKGRKSEETFSQTGEDTVNYASKRELISRLREELQKLTRRT